MWHKKTTWHLNKMWQLKNFQKFGVISPNPYRFWPKIRLCITSLLLASTLFACGGENVSDLETYVQQIKAKKKGKVPPLPQPQEFGNYEYISTNLRDPFRPIRKKATNNAPKPKNARPKCKPPRDVLENFPLDTLKMVGTLEKKKQRWALIKNTDGTLYRTKKGKCMGQNNGKIVRVTETEIELHEIVPDGLGGWMERKTVLSVSE